MLIQVGHVLTKESRQTSLQKSGSYMNWYIIIKLSLSVNQYHNTRKCYQIILFLYLIFIKNNRSKSAISEIRVNCFNVSFSINKYFLFLSIKPGLINRWITLPSYPLDSYLQWIVLSSLHTTGARALSTLSRFTCNHTHQQPTQAKTLCLENLICSLTMVGHVVPSIVVWSCLVGWCFTQG